VLTSTRWFILSVRLITPSTCTAKFGISSRDTPIVLCHDCGCSISSSVMNTLGGAQA
jgi:hypothetical protein